MRSWNSQTGWKITLVVPEDWKDEFGNVLKKERWPEFTGDLISIPVWKNGNIILHSYKERWRAFLDAGRFDAIYVHNEPYALAAAQICRANAATLRVPFGFYSAQNILKHYPPPFNWLERMVYKQKLLCLSNHRGCRRSSSGQEIPGSFHGLPASARSLPFTVREAPKRIDV